MKTKIAVLLMLVGLTVGPTARAEVIELKLGNTTPAAGNQSISATEFARRINEQMAGKVHVTVYDNSQLGNEREMLQKLKIGTLDFSQPSTIMSTVSPEFGLFDMPYLIKDRAHFERFLEKVFWSDIAPKAEAKGYKIVAVYENGFRHITNNKHPINTPEDLKGIKIRIPRGVWRQKCSKPMARRRLRWNSTNCLSLCRPASWTARKIRCRTSGVESSTKFKNTSQ